MRTQHVQWDGLNATLTRVDFTVVDVQQFQNSATTTVTAGGEAHSSTIGSGHSTYAIAPSTRTDSTSTVTQRLFLSPRGAGDTAKETTVNVSQSFAVRPGHTVQLTSLKIEGKHSRVVYVLNVNSAGTEDLGFTTSDRKEVSDASETIKGLLFLGGLCTVATVFIAKAILKKDTETVLAAGLFVVFLVGLQAWKAYRAACNANIHAIHTNNRIDNFERLIRENMRTSW